MAEQIFLVSDAAVKSARENWTLQQKWDFSVQHITRCVEHARDCKRAGNNNAAADWARKVRGDLKSLKEFAKRYGYDNAYIELVEKLKL